MFPRALIHIAVLSGLFATAATGANNNAASRPPSYPAAAKAALAMMKDIAPRGPASKTLLHVSSNGDDAWWGAIFGDARIAALVAVDFSKHQPGKPAGDGDLCLLLWNNGWQFQQWVGKVSLKSEDGTQVNWEIRYRKSKNTFYVVDRPEVFAKGPHLSWLCDVKTHTLKPTGWPLNAVPTFDDDTITFTRQEKPGVSPFLNEIHQFTDKPGKIIATIGDDQTVLAWDAKSGKWVKWHIWRKEGVPYLENDDEYFVSRNEAGKKDEPLRQDATLAFDWTGIQKQNALAFIAWRLSGLVQNSDGTWGKGKQDEFQAPKSVKVTGLSDAVRLFTWPENAAAPQP